MLFRDIPQCDMKITQCSNHKLCSKLLLSTKYSYYNATEQQTLPSLTNHTKKARVVTKICNP